MKKQISGRLLYHGEFIRKIYDIDLFLKKVILLILAKSSFNINKVSLILKMFSLSRNFYIDPGKILLILESLCLSEQISFNLE